MNKRRCISFRADRGRPPDEICRNIRPETPTVCWLRGATCSRRNKRETKDAAAAHRTAAEAGSLGISKTAAAYEGLMSFSFSRQMWASRHTKEQGMDATSTARLDAKAK